MITAQDKILHVASKLGLTSLKDMQASTGAVYDADINASGTLFTNASQHANPAITNLNQPRFEVNEALLIETIAFYANRESDNGIKNFQAIYGSNAVIVFDVVIGNKKVLKDVPVFGIGSPFTFASVGILHINATQESLYRPRHQVYMEGTGILIPPQVDFQVNYNIFNVVTGAILPNPVGFSLGCYLFGTKVLTNFNTSI